MARVNAFFLACVVFFLASTVAAQSNEENKTTIMNGVGALPDGARLQLGKFAGFRYHRQASNATMSADGTLLAAHDLRDAASIVDVRTGRIVQTLKANGLLTGGGMAFSADKSVLAMQAFDEIIVWDMASGNQLQRIGARNAGMLGRAPSISSDGKMVLAPQRSPAGTPKSGEVKVVEVATGNIIASLETKHDFDIDAVIAPNGKTMLCCERLNRLQIWDIGKGVELQQIKLAYVRCAAYAPDGKTIAVADGKEIRLFDLETGKEMRRLALTGPCYVSSLQFSPDGRQLVVLDGSYGNSQAWQVADGSPIALVKGVKARSLAAAFPGKDRIMVLGVLNSISCWWEASDTKANRFEGHLTEVADVVFSPDGNTIISADKDQQIIWWDANTGKETRRVTIPAEIGGRPTLIRMGNSIVVSPNGNHAATWYAGLHGVQIWDLKKAPRAIHDLRIPNTKYAYLEFSADGSKLAGAGTDWPTVVWDVGKGQRTFSIPANDHDTFIALSADGKLCATLQLESRTDRQVASHEIVIRDLAENKEQRRIKVNLFDGRGGFGLAFSPDGKLIALPDGQGDMLLLGTEHGRVYRSLTPTVGNTITQFIVSPDCRFLAVCGSPRGGTGESTIEIWEIASGQRREQFKGHLATVSCVAFSPDSATLATGSRDATVLLWDIAGNNAKDAPFAEKELTAAWKSLAGRDANVSLTLRRLKRSPATVPFLKQHFQPAKHVEVDQKKIAKWIGDLESSNFKSREVATQELKRLGEPAENALRKALEGSESIESRRRVQELLDILARADVAPEELQAIRGVEVLERIGSPEARELLTALSIGAPHARKTREATAALKRMDRK